MAWGGGLNPLHCAPPPPPRYPFPFPFLEALPSYFECPGDLEVDLDSGACLFPFWASQQDPVEIWNASLALLRTALQLTPLHPGFHMSLAETLLSSMNETKDMLEEALDHARTSFKLNP